MMHKNLLSIFVVFSAIFVDAALASEPSEGLPQHPQPYEKWQDPVSGLAFSWIPGDCFQLGSRLDLSPDHHEKPMHEVCLNGFWMGIHEVTNSQYRRYKPEHDSGKEENQSLNGYKQPVVNVSWNEAKAYARWLTEINNGKYKFRLPTEAEWEYSCRAGTETIRYWGQNSDDGCQYANVADLFYQNKRINYHNCFDEVIVSSSVGRYLPNASGLYDMLGNVWEWCEDNYGKDSYKSHEKINPVYRIFEVGTNYRVIRGGSWQSEPDSVRCAKRTPVPPESKFEVLGFRLVIEP